MPPCTAAEVWQVFHFLDPLQPLEGESWDDFEERLVEMWQQRENTWYTELKCSVRLVRNPKDALAAMEQDVAAGVYSADKASEWAKMRPAERQEFATKLQEWRHWWYGYDIAIWEFYAILELRDVVLSFRPWSELKRREVQALHGLGYVGPEEQAQWDASRGDLEENPRVMSMIRNGTRA